jgi:hypothetical protein
MAKEKLNLDIVIDTREQKPWDTFSDIEDKYYNFNIQRGTLKTGDYSLKGLEDIFVIERKASSAEIAQNIMEDRFEKEFKRLVNYKYKFVLCEFELRDIVNYPIGSGIPERIWASIKVSGKFILKRITELQLEYGVPFIFAGDFAVEQAIAIFKKVHKNEQYRQSETD